MFWIDDDGRPHILEEEMVMEGNDNWDCDRDNFLELVKGMCEKWPDEAISRMLWRGVDDLSSGTPFSTSFSAPHVGALKNAGEVVVQVGKKVGKKFLRMPRSFPRYVLSRCVLVSALTKMDETFRWLSNSSWLGLMTWIAYTGRVPLASNFATPADDSDRFEWLGIMSIAQGLQAQLEVRDLGEVAHGGKV